MKRSMQEFDFNVRYRPEEKKLIIVDGKNEFQFNKVNDLPDTMVYLARYISSYYQNEEIEKIYQVELNISFKAEKFRDVSYDAMATLKETGRNLESIQLHNDYISAIKKILSVNTLVEGEPITIKKEITCGGEFVSSDEWDIMINSKDPFDYEIIE